MRRLPRIVGWQQTQKLCRNQRRLAAASHGLVSAYMVRSAWAHCATGAWGLSTSPAWLTTCGSVPRSLAKVDMPLIYASTTVRPKASSHADGISSSVVCSQSQQQICKALYRVFDQTARLQRQLAFHL